MQFLDERIAEYDSKVSAMFASLAGTVELKVCSTSDDNSEQCPGQSPMPPPPVKKKLSAKELKNAVDIANLAWFMGFNMTSIPGIGYGTASIIASELGSKFDCFPSERHFASFIGLAPSLGKSAGKNVRQKKRCKNTSRVGQVLRMAASTLYRSKSELGAYMQSVARNTDKKTAIRATARRMAHMIYRGVMYGHEYIDSGAQAFEARRRQKTVRTVNRLIKSFKIDSSELVVAI